MNLPEKFAVIIPPKDISMNPGCLQRLTAGDRKAFQWLYDNYSPKVYDYAFLMTGDIQQSEDIVQEVFLKIWIHRDKMQHVNNFNGYIHMIIRNHILTQIRDRKREHFNLREYGKLQ